MTTANINVERITNYLAKVEKASANVISKALGLDKVLVSAILSAQVRRHLVTRAKGSSYYRLAEVREPLPEVDMSTLDFVELIIGKTLTYIELRKLVEDTHPGFTMKMDAVRKRIRVLRQSPYVNIERINEGVVAHHLISYSPEYVKYVERAKAASKAEMAARAARAAAAKEDDPRQVLRSSEFHPRERACCTMSSMFNDLLKSARKPVESETGEKA